MLFCLHLICHLLEEFNGITHIYFLSAILVFYLMYIIYSFFLFSCFLFVNLDVPLVYSINGFSLSLLLVSNTSFLTIFCKPQIIPPKNALCSSQEMLYFFLLPTPVCWCLSWLFSFFCSVFLHGSLPAFCIPLKETHIQISILPFQATLFPQMPAMGQSQCHVLGAQQLITEA